MGSFKENNQPKFISVMYIHNNYKMLFAGLGCYRALIPTLWAACLWYFSNVDVLTKGHFDISRPLFKSTISKTPSIYI